MVARTRFKFGFIVHGPLTGNLRWIIYHRYDIDVCEPWRLLDWQRIRSSVHSLFNSSQLIGLIGVYERAYQLVTNVVTFIRRYGIFFVRSCDGFIDWNYVMGQDVSVLPLLMNVFGFYNGFFFAGRECSVYHLYQLFVYSCQPISDVVGWLALGTFMALRCCVYYAVIMARCVVICFPFSFQSFVGGLFFLFFLLCLMRYGLTVMWANLIIRRSRFHGIFRRVNCGNHRADRKHHWLYRFPNSIVSTDFHGLYFLHAITDQYALQFLYYILETLRCGRS